LVNNLANLPKSDGQFNASMGRRISCKNNMLANFSSVFGLQTAATPNPDVDLGPMYQPYPGA